MGINRKWISGNFEAYGERHSANDRYIYVTSFAFVILPFYLVCKFKRNVKASDSNSRSSRQLVLGNLATSWHFRRAKPRRRADVVFIKF